MAHVLARLRNVKLEIIKDILTKDAAEHAKEGLFLEHLWQNADDQNEVLFLFRTTDLNHARKHIDQLHSHALQQDPKANFPQMTFLEEE
ncbi:MAG: hypothetical protein WC879_11040 [Melioribacteraceae bacterium]